MNLRPPNMVSDEAADREAIMAVVEAETRAYFAKDFDTWASFWVQDSEVERWVGQYGRVIRGWTDFEKAMRDAQRRYPSPIDGNLEKSRVSLRIGGDLAWLTYEERMQSEASNYALHVLNILIRVERGWKLVFTATFQCRELSKTIPMVSADTKGRIIDMNDQARLRLEHHSHLVVHNGVLRARNPRRARELRRALEQAPDVLYCRSPDLQASTKAGVRFPVMLGDVDAGDVAVCWIEPSIDRTFVTFDDFNALEMRIAVARMVFRLSPSQAKVARLIAEGLDCTAIAEHLLVTPNTARTHLRRIYEKTGVASQPALVRVLLSVGGI